METASKITNINIGNCFSAKIEVQVGCSCESDGQFEVLLPWQEFMNETESRNGTKSNTVRTFLTADFDTKVAKQEKWDLVKVICSQPYVKSETFGLAFIAIYTDKAKVKEVENVRPIPLQKSPRMIGKFKLREDSPEEDECKGSGLLERWKKEKKEETFITPPPKQHKVSSSKSVTDRNRMSLLYDSDSSDEENKRVKHSAKKLKVAEESRKRKSDDDSPIKKPKKAKSFSDFLTDDPKPKVDDKPSSKTTPSTSKRLTIPKQDNKKPEKAPESSKKEENNRRSPKTPVKPKLTRPFKELLNDVRIVISGIPNPERADIRQKALDMGAKYAGDWNSSCTHLICAFKNTPKFNQVKGKGKIVTKDWITNGHRLRKRLPWRRYALDDADRVADESEEEVFEEIANGNTDKKKEKDDILSMYDLDYDVPAAKPPHGTAEDDVYDRSTDDDNSRDAVKPKLFQGKSFYIHVNVEEDKSTVKHLEEVIPQQNGTIVKDLHAADFILTAEKLKADDLGAKGDIIIIDAKWVLECVEMESLIPIKGFSMKLE